MPHLTGHCLCGATRFNCSAPPLWQGHCHCRSCQLATGSAYTSYLGMAAGDWAWTGQPPAEYGSSPGVVRLHCATCGTPMGYASNRNPGAMDLFAATLDDPSAFRPTAHYFWEERLDWVAHDHSLPHQITPETEGAAVLDLIRNAFAGMEGRIDPPSSVHRLTVQDIAEQARDAEVWVSGTPPIACIFLTPRPDHLYLGKLAVAPGHQGQGLARKLIALAAERARALHLPALQLSTRVELIENHAAFQAMGFRKVGESAHPGHDRATSLIFRKEL